MGASGDPKSVEPARSLAALMVVEPEILVRVVIADCLRTCGYRVIETSTAVDVFTVLRTDLEVDVVLGQSRHLKADDGFSLAAEIHKHRPDIALILTSGLANIAEKASELCAKRIEENPFPPEEIMRRIKSLRARMRPSIAH
jgi:DNA-binding NtrC family response regulator